MYDTEVKKDEMGHQKAIISYPWLTVEDIIMVVDETLKNYYLSVNYAPLAAGQVLCRHGLDEMRRLWYSARMFLGYIGGGDSRNILIVSSYFYPDSGGAKKILRGLGERESMRRRCIERAKGYDWDGISLLAESFYESSGD